MCKCAGWNSSLLSPCLLLSFCISQGSSEKQNKKSAYPEVGTNKSEVRQAALLEGNSGRS